MWYYKFILACLLWYSKITETQAADKTLETEDDPPRVFFFIFGGLAIAGILRALIKILNIPIPFRVFILFVGGIIGILTKFSTHIEKYTRIVHLPPRYMLMSCLPLLMFKTAFCIDAHTFMRSWGQIFFLAVPGILINAFFTGMIMMVLLNHDDWTYAMGLMFGAICSSIYPIEIVSLLKEIGQAKHLSILLEGEGMIGDASVMIMFEILLGVIDENITSWYHVVMVFSRFALGGIALGLVLGKLMGWIMAVMYSDVVNMLIFSMVAAYLTYYIGAEMLSVSGVIAVVVLGIMVSMEKTSLSVDVEAFLMHFWDMLAYIANTMVFLLAGIIITKKLSQSAEIQDYALVLITYVVAGVGRLLEYILLAPIVSRIGYGLTFRNMTIAVWSGLRGPVPFCLTLSVYHHSGLSPLGRELLVHIAGLVALTLLINATTMPLLLRLLGLSELSMARKVNMNNCMRHLQNRRERTISMLKMDRFLADANWPLVNTATILKHPYKINYSDSDEEEENYLGFRITTCPDCQKEIPNEPTSKEMAEMIREARMRILKAKKISYARQYENGMLSKEGIRVLTQAIETAMDTPEALIELDGLHRYFKRQGFIHYTRRRLLAVFFKKSESGIKPPRKYWRRICYHIIMHPAFDVIIYCAILLNVIPIGLEIGLMPRSGTTLSLGLKVANTFFFLIYFIEFVLKIYGYSWIYIFKHGFRTYFGSYWNIFDFFVLCVCLIDLVLDYVDLFSKKFNKADSKASRVTVVTKLVRVIRLIRLLRLCKAWYPRLIQYCDSKIDKHLAFAYDVGKGFVTGEEEVSDMLIQMIDNKTIREDCRLRMEADRLAITKELGMVQKDRPWIAITVKTRQAVRATLNSMAEAVLELKVSGWVDDVEYAMLMESLEERLKYVRTKIKSVQPSPPKVMFKEVPWMADDEQISDFLYENVVTKIFDQGDVVCTDGEMADGIYIIVTGLFKLQYIPKKEILDNLAEYGSLPIMDYIASARFDEKVEDYIVSGNCVGELGVLTGRPYNCTVIADTASQAYILTHDVMKQAIQRSPDPINGLETKMWKCISIRLATSILMDTPVYQSSTQEKIRYHLERAFVPNLSHYKVFGVNDMMEDIILIEGVVFDYNTRDCYTAPCYIPRTVQKIVLPKSSHMNLETTIETKLLIIPAQDVDEFDIMEREEEISEMVSTASVRCLQHVIQTRASRMKRKKKRQTTFSMGHRRVKYGDSRISASQSLYYSRSRITEASSFERELRNISMNEPEGSNFVNYIINERDRRQSQDRRTSRLSGRRISSPGKRSLKETPNFDPNQDKKKLVDVKPTKTEESKDTQTKDDDKSKITEQSVSNMEESTLDGTLLDINPTQDTSDQQIKEDVSNINQEPKESIDKTQQEVPQKESRHTSDSKKPNELIKRKTLEDILAQQGYVQKSKDSESLKVPEDVKMTKKDSIGEKPSLEGDQRKSKDNSEEQPQALLQPETPISPDARPLKPEIPDNTKKQYQRRWSEQKRRSAGKPIAENQIPKLEETSKPSRPRTSGNSEEEERVQKVIDHDSFIDEGLNVINRDIPERDIATKREMPSYLIEYERSFKERNELQQPQDQRKGEEYNFPNKDDAEKERKRISITKSAPHQESFVIPKVSEESNPVEKHRRKSSTPRITEKDSEFITSKHSKRSMSNSAEGSEFNKEKQQRLSEERQRLASNDYTDALKHQRDSLKKSRKMTNEDDNQDLQVEEEKANKSVKGKGSLEHHRKKHDSEKRDTEEGAEFNKEKQQRISEEKQNIDAPQQQRHSLKKSKKMTNEDDNQAPQVEDAESQSSVRMPSKFLKGISSVENLRKRRESERRKSIISQRIEEDTEKIEKISSDVLKFDKFNRGPQHRGSKNDEDFTAKKASDSNKEKERRNVVQEKSLGSLEEETEKEGDGSSIINK